MCGYEVHCDDVVDLTSDAAIDALGIAPGDLACPWEDLADRGGTPPTWELSDRLIAGGAAGVIIPSFADRAGPDDRNLVFWKWGTNLPHKVCVVDDYDRLPKDDRSWKST
jgi:RES domain-containing protein